MGKKPAGYTTVTSSFSKAFMSKSRLSSGAERVIGNDEATSSILVGGTISSSFKLLKVCF